MRDETRVLQRLAAIVDASPDAIISGTLDGIVQTWSPGAERIYGYTAEEMIGTSVDRLRAGEDTPRFERVRDRLLAGRSLHDVEVRQRRKDGRLIDVSYSASPLTDATGRTVAVAGIARDITGRLRIAGELHEHRERGRLAFDNAPIGMALVAPSGQLLAVNRELCRLLARDEETLLKLDVQRITHPEDLASDRHLMEQVVAGKRASYVLEKRFLRPDGSAVWIQLATALARDPEGRPRYFVSQLLDITHRKLEEERVRRLAGRFAALERRAARSSGARGLAGGNGDGGLAGGTSDGGTPRFVTDTPNLRSAQKRVRFLLSLVRRELAMDLALWSEHTDDDVTVMAIDGDGSAFGLSEGEVTPRSTSIFRALAAGDVEPVVPDARRHAALRDVPMVSDGKVGAYVGAALTRPSGGLLGTLSAMSHDPRPDLDGHSAKLLRAIGEVFVNAIEPSVEERQWQRAEAEIAGVRVLAAALEARDHSTGEHSLQVVQLALAVATRLGLSSEQLDEVEHVALLHDIGKVGIPDTVLQKPGVLTDTEWALMRQHPAVGERIVASTSTLSHLAGAIRAEHEHYDGSGYPDGLRGDEIPISSRITLACDAWQAMTSDRPYRRAMPVDEARRELLDNAGRAFDPDVVSALLEIVDAGDAAITQPE